MSLKNILFSKMH
jgi:hypothetical protein